MRAPTPALHGPAIATSIQRSSALFTPIVGGRVISELLDRPMSNAQLPPGPRLPETPHLAQTNKATEAASTFEGPPACSPAQLPRTLRTPPPAAVSQVWRHNSRNSFLCDLVTRTSLRTSRSSPTPHQQALRLALRLALCRDRTPAYLSDVAVSIVLRSAHVRSVKNSCSPQ